MGVWTQKDKCIRLSGEHDRSKPRESPCEKGETENSSIILINKKNHHPLRRGQNSSAPWEQRTNHDVVRARPAYSYY